jgi:hypothetical protein
MSGHPHDAILVEHGFLRKSRRQADRVPADRQSRFPSHFGIPQQTGVPADKASQDPDGPALRRIPEFSSIPKATDSNFRSGPSSTPLWSAASADDTA